MFVIELFLLFFETDLEREALFKFMFNRYQIVGCVFLLLVSFNCCSNTMIVRQIRSEKLKHIIVLFLMIFGRFLKCGSLS